MRAAVDRAKDGAMSTIPFSRFALPFSLVLLAACARSEEASLVPPEGEGYNAVEKVRTPERDDDEAAIGEWRRTAQDERIAIEFGPMGAQPLFSIICAERGGLVLQRHGTITTGDLPMMMVQVGSEARRLAVSEVGGTVPMLRAEVAPSDDLVGTLAQAESPVTVRIGDAPPLIMDPDPVIGRFVEDCRTGRTAADTQAPAEAAEPAGTEAAPAAAPSG